MQTRIAVGLIMFVLSGCASYTGWEPTVDPRMGAGKDTLNRDIAECKELALKASGGTATEIAKGVGVGALGGAAVGAVIGAVSGDAGSGAAMGAAVGGTGGGVHQGAAAEDQYKRSYIKCVEGRGHRVLN